MATLIKRTVDSSTDEVFFVENGLFSMGNQDAAGLADAIDLSRFRIYRRS